jgi:hypothetical protein
MKYHGRNKDSKRMNYLWEILLGHPFHCGKDFAVLLPALLVEYFGILQVFERGYHRVWRC